MPKRMPREPEEDVGTIIQRRADERLQRERLEYAKQYGINGIASLKVPE